MPGCRKDIRCRDGFSIGVLYLRNLWWMDTCHVRTLTLRYFGIPWRQVSLYILYLCYINSIKKEYRSAWVQHSQVDDKKEWRCLLTSGTYQYVRLLHPSQGVTRQLHGSSYDPVSSHMLFRNNIRNQPFQMTWAKWIKHKTINCNAFILVIIHWDI